MRLIDADVLLEKAWDADTRVGYVQVVDVGDILEAPTIDSVKHGHWIDIDDELITGTCSVCGWDAIFAETDVVGMSYCPNCGAKMDEVMKDE